MKNICWSICATLPLLASAVQPIFDDAYTADPAPIVVGDTVYCFAGHDADDATGFKMPDWRLYSSKDMKHWKAHGPVATPETFTWAKPNTCWAAQCVERDGKFFFYVTTDKKDGHMAIGVLVADRPEGPYRDPLGGPLIHHCPGDIDPTVLIDDDGQAYLYWGNPLLHTAKLNRDMISIDKSFGTDGIHVVEKRIKDYQEGPWAWKRNGIYYMAFASTCCPEGIGYATSRSPLGPWEYRGHIMDHDGRSSGNHPGIIEFKGKWYCFGFNYERYKKTGATQHCERRSVCVAEMKYNPDGTIVQMPWWAECPEIDGREPVIEIKAFQHPDKRGGLMLKVRVDGGEWRDAAEPNRAFTHSNLGNWGEKNLFDPVLFHDDDGMWHVYYKDRLAGGKDCHAVSWNKDDLTDWGRQNWVDNDKDRERLRKARAGDGIWRITSKQLVKLGKSEWHQGGPWHFTLDQAKDDEERYGEAVRTSLPRLRLAFSDKPAYPISRNLMGIFFEDINESHEVYSTNHVGTYKGHGFRKDIGEALAALKPKFVRFPGGCIVHAFDFKGMYHWKETVGPLSERKGKPNHNWGGFQDFALGYYEYFQLCEDIGADAVPILPAGVTCPNPQVAVTDEELEQLAQDAADLIDFAKGDPKKSKWAKLRADMGHPKPFGLKYIGIGNEDDVNDYFERGFKRIFRAVREKDPSVKVVGTAGAFCAGRDYEEGWKLGKRMKVDLLDEHYYVGPGWYYGNQLFYDDYDRKGPKVYVGEYAAHKKTKPEDRHNVNDMETALALALHLTNLERNGDVVEMASYAPLFGKKEHLRWSPDLIYFDDNSLELTTDYWAQWVFGNYAGDKYVPHTLEVVHSDGKVGVKSNTDWESPRLGKLNSADSQRFYNRFSSSVVRAKGKTIVKLVNTTGFSMPVEADFSKLGVGAKGRKAEFVVMAGAFDAKDVKPVKSQEKISAKFERTLPGYSLTVIAF